MNPNNKLAKSMYSFKILKECPIIIVLLFQLHKKIFKNNVDSFIPLVIEVKYYFKYIYHIIIFIFLLIYYYIVFRIATRGSETRT